MVAQKGKKRKSKKPSKRQLFIKRSRAAKKGWATRRAKTKSSRKTKSSPKTKLLLKEIKTLEKTIKRLQIELEDSKKQLTTRPKEAPQFPPPPQVSRNYNIKTFMDRALRLYSKGPGLLDMAYELAEYYEIDVDEVMDIWYM